jgi:two-component sensor histidine kinase|tara:strand:+ start:3828 stop:5729 length:1902 start_codon:yes stop_codon:yes gene_type:complete
MKFLKIIALFLFVINSFSQDQKNDTIILNSFLNQTNYSNKKIQLFKRILVSNSSTKTTEEWIHFFNKEETKTINNFNELFYIVQCKSMLYIHVEAYEKSNDILYSFYYKYKNVANKDKLCSILNTLSNNYIKLNKKSELLLINKELLEICPKISKLYGLYSKIRLVDLAIKNYKKTNPYKGNDTDFNTGKNQNNIGVFYKRDKKYDSAFYYFDKSLNILEKLKQKGTVENKEKLNYWIGLVKGNLGECYLEFKNYDKALELFSDEEKEARIWFEIKKWIYEDDYYRNIATCFLNTGKLNLAKKYIDSLFLKKNTLYYTKLKSEYFDITKRYDSAHYYNKLFLNKSDSIEEQNKQELNNIILNLIDFQEELVTKELEIEEHDKLHHRELIIILFILIFLITLIAILVILIYKKSNQKGIIEKQNESINSSLLEKNVLLGELHHRVKNNFQIMISILNLQLQKLKNNEFKTTFQYSINRVTTIARIHDKLLKSKSLSEIGTKDYIESIIDDLKIIYNNLDAIDIRINVDSKIFIFIDQTQALGLIINELITNSNKYAFTRKTNNLIQLNIIEKEGVIYFDYLDNGVGFDLNNINKKNSIGLTLIQRLVNQLGTEANINSKKGMQITFSFKNKLNF